MPTLHKVTDYYGQPSRSWKAGCFLCLPGFEGYVAVPAFHVDLPGRPDDCTAYRADVLDAAVPAGGFATPDRDLLGRLAVVAVASLARITKLQKGQAAGGDVYQLRLPGDPGRRFFGQGRDGPAVGLVLLDVEPVGLGGLLKLLIVVVPVVAHVLDAVGQVVQAGHFVQHGGRHLADGPVDVLGRSGDGGVMDCCPSVLSIKEPFSDCPPD